MGDNTFTYNYHKDTIDKGKALRNEDGSLTTVRTAGVFLNGRIYNIPTYNNETGKIMEQEEALEKFRPNIERGEVESFPAKFGGPIEEHPANIAARTDHHLIEADNDRAGKAIGFDMFNPKRKK